MNIDDLLDGEKPPAAERPAAKRAPRKKQTDKVSAPDSTLSAKELTAAATGTPSIGDWTTFLQPVTTNWLAKVFQMDPETAKKRLVKCPTVGAAGGGRPLYDFRQAAGYLVKPMMDMDDYIRSIDPAKLPNHINKAYWEAKRIRLKYLHEAKEAWATADVLEVFGDVFLTLKNVIQLWPDTVKENTACSDDQYLRLRQMADGLQSDLYDKLVKMPGLKQTQSIAVEAPAATDDEGDFGELLE